MKHIHYRIAGKISSPICLVFIHGMLCDESNWNAQIKYFKTHYQILTLDLPGHGQSTLKAYQQWDVVNLALDLKQFLLGLNLQKQFVVVAHSASVRIALELNYLLDQDLAGLVLLDCGYQVIHQPDAKQWLASLRQKGYTAWLTQFFSSKFGPSSQAMRDEMLQTAFKLDPTIGEALYLNIKLYDYYSIEKCLKLTKVPILVLQSSFYKNGQAQVDATEGEVHSEWLELIKATVPDAQIQILLDCGHWIMLQQSDVCNRSIERFIKPFLQSLRHPEQTEGSPKYGTPA